MLLQAPSLTHTISPIRVAPGGRYFETFDGDPFLFIGFNDAITWPGLAGLYRQKNLDSVDAYLEGLATSGVTILRFMLEYVQRKGRHFERRIGYFNPAMIRLWDDLLARCEKLGLWVLLTPWDTFGWPIVGISILTTSLMEGQQQGRFLSLPTPPF